MSAASAPSYKNTADQQTAAALQAYVATPVSLTATGSAHDALARDVDDATRRRVMQTINTYGSEALQDNVQMVTLINESLNANKYIQDVMAAESGRVGGMDVSVKNEQQKLKNTLMMNRYLIGYYSVATSVVVLTMVVTLLLLLPAALWRAGRMHVMLFASIVLVILLVYLAAVVTTVGRTAMRRSDAWGQLNWQVSKAMAKQLEDANRAATACSAPPTIGGSTELTCADAATQYKSMYSDTMRSPAQLAGVSAASQSWADYLVGKQANAWPGQSCKASTSCDDALAIYKIMYPPPYGPGVTAAQDHLNHPSNEWATSSPLC